MNLFLKSLTGLISCFFLFTGCETSVENEINVDTPLITQFSISPDEVNFNRETDRINDTTLTINFSGQVQNTPENTNTYFSITDIQNNVLIREGNFDLTAVTTELVSFDQDIAIQISTTTISNFLIMVTVTNSNGIGNYAQGILKINGISNSSPEILEVNNPDEYIIPDSGTENIRFTAKVTDIDGQNNIESVFLRLLSRSTGEVANSPFELYDDGESLGDQVASDSIYTLTFPVSSDNRPDTYDIKYYATDRAGLVSDTVSTIFRLVE